MSFFCTQNHLIFLEWTRVEAYAEETYGIPEKPIYISVCFRSLQNILPKKNKCYLVGLGGG